MCGWMLFLRGLFSELSNQADWGLAIESGMGRLVIIGPVEICVDRLGVLVVSRVGNDERETVRNGAGYGHSVVRVGG